MGEFGQADYCAANNFLDAFAHRAASRNGTFTTSINWDTWQEVGMAVNAAVSNNLKSLQEEGLKQGLLSAEGVDVFSRALSSTLPQVIVSVQDLQNRLERNYTFAPDSLLEEMEGEHLLHPTYPRPELANPYIAPGNMTERVIAGVWQKVLGIGQIGIHDNFFELGGDSLTAVQVIAALKKELAIEVPAVAIFEGPTISSLAKSLAPEQSENVSFQQRRERGERRREKRNGRAQEV
jgi:acyl carrier protein